MAPTDNFEFARKMQAFYKAVEEDGGFEEKEDNSNKPELIDLIIIALVLVFVLIVWLTSPAI